MFIGQGIILGIIQGLTEFLPISSSGHLIVVPFLFNWPDQGLAFDTFVHLGTLLAVVVYFHKELKNIVLAMLFPKVKIEHAWQWRRMGWYVLLATIPAAIFGLLFKEQVGTILRTPTIVAISLLVWAGVLWIAESYSEKYANQKSELLHIGFWQSFGVGLWQVIALIPGTSRSGITMTGGLLAGMSKHAAIKFSFLLSIPVIAAAGFFSFIEMLSGASDVVYNWSFVLSGFFSAAVSGYIAIAILLRLVEHWGFRPFVIYRVLLALLLLFFVN